MDLAKKFTTLDSKVLGKEQFAASGIVGRAFLISIIVGLTYTIIFADPKFVVQSDVVSFLTGALMIRNKVGVNLYDLPTQLFYQNQIVSPFVREAVLPFKIFAPFALPFVPLTSLPLKTAYMFFAFLNFALLGLLPHLTAMTLNKLREFRFWYLAPFIFLPSILSVILGQLSIVLAFIYFLIFKFVKDKKEALAGVFSALLLIKPQYVIAIPFFLLLSDNRRSFLKGFLIVFFILILSTLIISSPDALLKYPSFLLLTENEFFSGHSQRMLTVSSTLYYNLPMKLSSYKGALSLNALFYFIVYCIFIKKYKRVNFDYAFASAVIFSLLFAVHVLEHDLAILMVPFLILLNIAVTDKKNRKTLYILAFLLFLMPQIVLIISPAFGSIMTIFIAITLLYKKTNFGFLWKRK